MPAQNTAAYLLVLGERQAIAWVLRTERMAFRDARLKPAKKLRVGDALFIYTSRGAFGNPTRHRGRVIGTATVASTVAKLRSGVEIADEKFDYGCKLDLLALAPFEMGIELAPLVYRLSVFPDRRSWSARLRNTLVPLSASDARLIQTRLESVVTKPSTVLEQYLRWNRPAGEMRKRAVSLS